MSERKYYVICGNNCKFESMTKEQITTAIQEAVTTGEIKDIDAGFITKVKEQNAGRNLTFWVGTTAEYNAIPEAEKYAECLYIKTDDTFQEDIISAINEIAEFVDQTYGMYSMHAEIIINTVGGEFVCTNENGEEIKPSKQLETKWVFPTSKYGIYTITGVYGGITKTHTVKIDAVKQYPLDFVFFNDDFSSNEWETIISICKNNVVPDTWKVGDSKQITLTDKNKFNVIIIGKNHDDRTDGTKSSLTLGYINDNDNTYYMNTGETTGTNVGGWENCVMRTTYITTLVNANLPDIIKDNVCTVKKYTSEGNRSTALEITQDRYFLLSEVECFGSVTYSASGEGTQYEYFKNSNKFDKNFWLRSPDVSNGISFCLYNGGMPNTSVAHYRNQALIAFCL